MEVHLVADTNLFFECKSLEDLPWSELERLNVYEHGRSVMEALLGIFGKYRTNPVEVPAEAFRRLLWPAGDWPQDWKQIVERTILLRRRA
jgi:hypothetical protein